MEGHIHVRLCFYLEFIHTSFNQINNFSISSPAEKPHLHVQRVMPPTEKLLSKVATRKTKQLPLGQVFHTPLGQVFHTPLVDHQ